VSGFQIAKLELVAALGLAKDALHIYVGLLVFLLAAIISRRPLKSLVPIGAVLLAALAGEAWDMLDTAQAGQRLRWDKSWHDLWNTAFWPFVLFLLARYTRLLKL
jgi:cell shape-determining protein MreD